MSYFNKILNRHYQLNYFLSQLLYRIDKQNKPMWQALLESVLVPIIIIL
jgi:hypothetical protein